MTRVLAVTMSVPLFLPVTCRCILRCIMPRAGAAFHLALSALSTLLGTGMDAKGSCVAVIAGNNGWQLGLLGLKASEYRV